jgi:organic radical activating enzyme
MNQSNWYCKLPWTGFSNDPSGQARPCCIFKDYIRDQQGQPMYVQTHHVRDIFQSQYMKDLRNQFRKGQKPSACSTCVTDEANGYTSKRQIYLSHPELLLDVDYNNDPEYPVEYQMILSNACNLKCRSCTPSHSSLWQAEYHQLFGDSGYEMPHGQSGENQSLLWETRSEWVSKVKRLEVVGGEPFYIKRWQTLWEEMIDLGYSKEVYLYLSSNASIFNESLIVRLIENFKVFGMGLSIDGLEKVYEYLRHPAQWDTVNKNARDFNTLAQRFANKNFYLTVSHTIGWINAWQLPEFHDYVQDTISASANNIWNNIIHYPPHMALFMIPQDLKDLIKNKWSQRNWGKYTKDVDGIINHMYSKQPSDGEIAESYKKFVIHDRARNECLLDILPPEILEYIEPYYKEAESRLS